MEEKLLSYFNSIMPLTEEENNAIAATITTRRFKKGNILLHEGDVSTEAYFVLEGCVREYYLVDGEEKTSAFYLPGNWVTSIQSFRESKPSKHFIECATEVNLVVGNREKEAMLYKKFPRLETISRMIMEQMFAEQHQALSVYLTDTPEQRYARLAETRPELFKLVPQYQIASYIGIKPESLSRIRKRILNNKP